MWRMSVQCMLGAHSGQRMASAALSVAWTAGTPPVQGLCHQLHTAHCTQNDGLTSDKALSLSRQARVFSVVMDCRTTPTHSLTRMRHSH